MRYKKKLHHLVKIILKVLSSKKKVDRNLMNSNLGHLKKLNLSLAKLSIIRRTKA